MSNSAENYLISKLQDTEHNLKVITESIMVHKTFNHDFSESNIETIREQLAEIKQRAIELELFIDVNCGKEVQNGTKTNSNTNN